MPTLVSRSLHRLRAAVALPILAAVASWPAAQVTTLTAPTAAAARDGAGVLSAAGFTRSMRQQFVFGESHLAAARGKDLVALRFRRDGYVVEHPAGSAEIRVRVSASLALDPTRVSASFAANHVAPPVVVYSGTLLLPRSPALSHRHAATWTEPDAVTIPFVPVFRYDGGALCVEIEGSPTPGATSTWWSIDAERARASGAVTMIGQGCGATASRVSRLASADARTLVPGSSTRMLSFGPPASAAVMFLGAERVGPIDLGFLGAPGCDLEIAPAVWLGAAMQARVPLRPAAANVVLQLPGDSWLTGGAFYVQWANWEGRTLTTSNALHCQLATNMSDLDAAVVTGMGVGIVLPVSGRVDVGIMPVVQFDCRAP